MATGESHSHYLYENGLCNDSHDYLLPEVQRLVRSFRETRGSNRIFDLGCGNGSVAAALTAQGFEVRGVDASETAIEQAHKWHPQLDLQVGSAYDDLASKHGKFPIVVSLEVVEHVYSPRKYARTLADLLEPQGVAIISTPYHGYFKNLVMAAAGRMDRHYLPLWDDGHIKFWSRDTLGQLMSEVGIREIDFRRVGRIPALAKSMIFVGRAQ